ncbi:hypothetical protein [Dyella sp.]|jgi:hypothetical protein|uniref:hypothetical protein n=1 Tax=Dyella sp. TaxID=1869338 RepID=UPI002FDAB5FA
MATHLRNHFTFTDDARFSLGEDPDVQQIGAIPYTEGMPVPSQGDLVQVSINGKSRQFVVVLRQFIYEGDSDISIRYVLDTIR